MSRGSSDSVQDRDIKERDSGKKPQAAVHTFGVMNRNKDFIRENHPKLHDNRQVFDGNRIQQLRALNF